MEFEGWYNLLKEEGGSTVGQVEGEGKFPFRTHKSWASLMESCPIIQSKHVDCPSEAMSWGKVALCRGRPLELTAGKCLLTALSDEQLSLLEGMSGWCTSVSPTVGWGENVWVVGRGDGIQSFYLIEKYRFLNDLKIDNWTNVCRIK